MTYEDALAEVKVRDQRFEEFHDQHTKFTDKEDRVSRHKELPDILKLPGCPPNHSRVVYQPMGRFFQTIVREKGVTFVPVGVMACSPTILDTLEHLPLTVLSDDSWSVLSRHDDFDW